jgi:hypothetical protein
MDGTAKVRRLLLELIEVVEVIIIGKKTGRPIIPALDDVPGDASYCDAWSSRHLEILFVDASSGVVHKAIKPMKLGYSNSLLLEDLSRP